MKPTILTLLGLLLALCATVSAAKKPNILFIVADDQSPFDFKAYDPSSPLDAPVIGKIAKEGMVFDAAYHMGSMSGAVCSPSRTMIMSGRTLWHLPPRGKKHLKREQGITGGKGILNNTLPAVFNRAGYDTMRTCKKGNSYSLANAQFQVVHDATKRGGTAESGSAWHGQQVINYLNEREKTDDSDPFFIYFGFSHPHDVRDGTPELLEKYGAVNHRDRKSLPPANPKAPSLPLNWLPKHPFHHGHPGLRDEVSVGGVWERRDEVTIRNEIGRQLACSENIDQQVGRVLKKLKAMGELDNTYIIYTADHGMAIGRHGLQGKQNLYEHTWRVPLFVKGPGIKAGSRVTGNVYLLDTLSTLCDLAGIAIPATSQGRSFKPVLMGKADTVRDVLYGAYCGGTKPGMRSVRKGDWKLIKYDVMDGKVRQTQLFNLRENPHEYIVQNHDSKVKAQSKAKPGSGQLNLAGDPGHADKLKEMEALLYSEMKRLGDPHRLWNQPEK
jgi:arylsulfatase A-like enzyme